MTATDPSRQFCPDCNAPRAVDPCFKCGAALGLMAEGWDHPALPDIQEVRRAAHVCGYALAVHGSLERDLDLIAVPWIFEARSPEALIRHICEAIDAEQVGPTERKPHGRIAVSIKKRGWYRMIDLSITMRNL